MIEDLDDSNVESRASEAANLAISKKLSAVKILVFDLLTSPSKNQAKIIL